MSILYKNKIFLVAVFSFFLTSLIQTFRVELLDALFFLIIFVELSAVILLLISLVLSTIYIFRSRKKLSVKNFLPLVINLITVFVLIFTPLSDIMINVNFSINKNAREEVAKLIHSGVLIPNVAHNKTLIHLPEKYQYLSKGGGDVKFANTKDGTAVFFYVFRGVLDNYSGFAYCPSDKVECTGNFVYENDILQHEKLDKHWYWLASQ